MPYVNNTAGFEIAVPADWSYEYEGFAGPSGSRGLLRGGTLNGRTAIQVFFFERVDAKSLDDWAAAFGKSLGSIDGVLDVQTRAGPAGARPSLLVLVRAQIGVDLVETVYDCVKFDDSHVWVLSWGVARAGAEPDGPQAIPPLAQRVMQSLRVFYDSELAARIEQARKRGAEYVRKSLPRDIRALRLDQKTRRYIIEQRGQPVGFVERTIRPEQHSLDDGGGGGHAGQPGLRVHEETWRFFDHEIVRFSVADMFSSVDGKTDLYEFTTSTTAPGDAPVQKPFVTRDECLRADDRLVSSYTTSRHVVLPDPRPPIMLGADYLGLAWVRALPGLLGARGDELYAFTTYDADNRALMVYSIRFVGQRTLGDAAASAYVFEVRDGLSETPRLIFADQYGNVLRQQAGDITMRLSDAETIERVFGRHRDAARPRLSSK